MASLPLPAWSTSYPSRAEKTGHHFRIQIVVFDHQYHCHTL